jgi:hypothetical protein
VCCAHLSGTYGRPRLFEAVRPDVSVQCGLPDIASGLVPSGMHRFKEWCSGASGVSDRGQYSPATRTGLSSLSFVLYCRLGKCVFHTRSSLLVFFE